MNTLSKAAERTKAEAEGRFDGPDERARSTHWQLIKLEDDIAEVEAAAAYMVGTERELLSQLEEAAFMSGELGRRAAQAEEAGRDYVVRLMLEEKAHYDGIAEEIRLRYMDARCRVQELIQKLYDMKELAYGLRKMNQPTGEEKLTLGEAWQTMIC